MNSGDQSPSEVEKLRRDFIDNHLGGVERIRRRMKSQKAGLDYVQNNRETLYKDCKYKGKWIAANGEGVVDHDKNLLDLKKRIKEKGVSIDTKYGHLATGAVYFEYCKYYRETK